MSSMQGRQSGGVENPSLEVTQRQKMFDSYNGHNGVAYYNDSNSSNSLSLSSSTADSLDTVIYKTPSSMASAAGRYWNEQPFPESRSMVSDMEPNSTHAVHKNASNIYPENGNQLQESHQFQQGPNPSVSQFSGHNSFGLEYRSSQNQQHLQQLQQHLSAQSLAHPPSSQNDHSTLRTGNGPSANGNINAYSAQSLPQSTAANGPFNKHKQFSAPSNNPLDKSKESTKLFHTKTYNHIKDMISSRFGNTNNVAGDDPIPNNAKGVLSSASPGSDRTLNNSVNTNGGMQYNNGTADLNGGGNIGLPVTTYNPHHHHNHSSGVGVNHNAYALHVSNGHGPSYRVVPHNFSPDSQNGGRLHDASHSSFPGNSYRSPQMSDRKDVNTSFRKAIQQSTQKSNLTEQSLQLRKSIAESRHGQNFEPEPEVSQNGLQSYEDPSSGFGSTLGGSGHIERANRALDQLLDPEAITLQEGSSAQNLSNSYSYMSPFRSNEEHRQPQQAYKTQPPEGVTQISNKTYRSKNTTNTLPVISNSIKTLSKGAHAPISDPKISGSHNESQPQYSQVHNSQGAPLGLPPLPLVRENGDGSSVTVEGLSNTGNEPSGGSNLRHHGLQVVALSPGTENASSSSECEVKGGQRVGSGQSHTTTDSGLGTVDLTKSPQHSGNTNEQLDGLLGHRVKFNDNMADSISSGNDSEWVDIVEPEIRQILQLERLKKASKSSAGPIPSVTNVLHSESDRRSNVNAEALRSTHLAEKCTETGPTETPIVETSPKVPKKFDLTNYNKKSSHEVLPGPSSGQGSSPGHSPSKPKSSKLPTTLLRSNSGSGHRSNAWTSSSRQRLLLNDKGKASTVGRKDLVSQTKAGKLTRNAMSQILYSLHDDAGDMTSTTGGLDLESMLDGRTEHTSDDDDDLSTTIDTTDAHAIRRQLESLESMYTEVLKVLGGKKQMPGARHPPPVSSDLRHARRRPYGSMSSLPSSVSSRPFRESRKRIEDKKKVKDIKSISRRFQRLESHVVTLARSVAHLSSEMRTQHLMVQEMEAVRNELNQLRNQVLKSAVQSQSAAAAFAAANGQGVVGRGATGRQGVQSTDWTSFRNALPSLTNPCRVRKLTKFFGDEPPLIRIFLKKLGYEKYAYHFEQERIGIMELPYLTEERLQKMGIPMGPRLRILQEAHLCLKPGAQFTVETQHNGNTGNLSVYVV